MTKMIGPGGPDHCSVMNCLGKAVVEKDFVVVHPRQEQRTLFFYFCAEHEDRGFDPWKYPNYKETRNVRL